MVPIRVRFIDKMEVRMGSPYAICRVSLSGTWIPELPNNGEGFQDVKAWSQDKTTLGLIQWQVNSNEPGFRILSISVQEKQVLTSQRISGCCCSFEWRDGAFRYRAFTEISGNFPPQSTASRQR